MSSSKSKSLSNPEPLRLVKQMGGVVSKWEGNQDPVVDTIISSNRIVLEITQPKQYLALTRKKLPPTSLTLSNWTIMETFPPLHGVILTIDIFCTPTLILSVFDATIVGDVVERERKNARPSFILSRSFAEGNWQF